MVLIEIKSYGIEWTWLVHCVSHALLLPEHLLIVRFERPV